MNLVVGERQRRKSKIIGVRLYGEARNFISEFV
jgi:hypothetical protein